MLTWQARTRGQRSRAGGHTTLAVGQGAGSHLWPGTECKWDSASLDTRTYVPPQGAVLGRSAPETPALERGKESRAHSLIYDTFIDLPEECL